jgi:hypothetical protein
MLAGLAVRWWLYRFGRWLWVVLFVDTEDEKQFFFER